MKQFISILLVTAVLFSTVGITVAEHFCLKSNKKIETETCCKKCQRDCCRDELKVFKLSYESVLSNLSKIIKPALLESFAIYHSPVITLDKSIYRNFLCVKSPPVISCTSEPSFIKVFLI